MRLGKNRMKYMEIRIVCQGGIGRCEQAPFNIEIRPQGIELIRMIILWLIHWILNNLILAT